MREHYKQHIDDLIEFSKRDFEYVKIPGNLPLLNIAFEDVVHYECLDNEIKIGQFYARMWVINANKIQMTYKEVEEFHQKVTQLLEKNTDPHFLNSRKLEAVKNIAL
jgi:hypothetical protein